MEMKSDYLFSHRYDSPSIIINLCSPKFKRLIDCADVIISILQGKLKNLPCRIDKNRHFRKIKPCDVIAETFSFIKGEFVVKKNNIHL
jgi:uncharacterized protein with ATP-grasp and redox domains